MDIEDDEGRLAYWKGPTELYIYGGDTALWLSQEMDDYVDGPGYEDGEDREDLVTLMGGIV